MKKFQRVEAQISGCSKKLKLQARSEEQKLILGNNN